ncbi:probable calcium-binding protein CML27 [Impatiens glandulifera]|uniref:probable calcium-binding protein CML27 n=1 Tax=Impatiens glandulifera TaxID=253017 RepID=UPI001FB0C612|nr:probable calcium-binding protein CML27 [Impatiens glandulifera]
MATNNKSVYLQNPDEVKKVFSRFDTNGDGKISVTELVHVMKACGSNTSEDEVQRMMEAIDTDRDGFFNLEEFTTFCGSSGGDDSENGVRELKDAFELYDKDNNGLISSGELQQMMTNIGEKCSVDDCELMIKPVDSNGDGSVSFDEFKKMITDSGTTAATGESDHDGPTAV